MKIEEFQLLAAIQNIQTRFIENAPADDVFGLLLAEILKLTGSEFGFIGDVNTDEAGQRFLQTNAISNVAWNDATRALYEANARTGFRFDNLDTLFGEVLRTGRRVCTNEPGRDPRAAGLPPGHPPLHAFLGLPLYHQSDLVGMIGLANRPGGYSESFADQLAPLLLTCSGIIFSYRAARSQREALAALADSEAQFRQLAEHIQEVFWLYDGRLNKVVYCSPAYEDIWGYPVAKLLADPDHWISTIHVEDRERVETAFRSALAKQDYDIEYRILRPDGTERWVHDRGYPVHSPGQQVKRIAGIAEDVTDRQRLRSSLRRGEQRLRHSQRIESLGRVAGGVAHDFNNLLTVINGNCRKLLAGGPVDVQRLLLQIRQAGDRAVGLTRQLLAFSRKQVLALQIVDVRDLLRDLGELLPSLLGNDIDLHSVESPEPLLVRADPSQLTQVMMNLAVNGAEAMPNGGRLEITSRRCDARTDAERGLDCDWVEVTVTDHGCGIDPKVLPYVCDPFFSTKPEGTGLGLSTAFGIVSQLGGSLDVESTTGAVDGPVVVGLSQGTRCRVRLPVSTGPGGERDAAAPPQTAAPQELDAPAEGLQILLVEDEDLVRSFAAMALVDDGHRVYEAADAVAALDLAQRLQGRLDLMVTDVVLPGRSGVELAADFRAADRQRPVLFVSGYASKHAELFGVDSEEAFCSKPFSASELCEAVRTTWAARHGSP